MSGYKLDNSWEEFQRNSAHQELNNKRARLSQDREDSIFRYINELLNNNKIIVDKIVDLESKQKEMNIRLNSLKLFQETFEGKITEEQFEKSNIVEMDDKIFEKRYIWLKSLKIGDKVSLSCKNNESINFNNYSWYCEPMYGTMVKIDVNNIVVEKMNKESSIFRTKNLYFNKEGYYEGGLRDKELNGLIYIKPYITNNI